MNNNAQLSVNENRSMDLHPDTPVEDFLNWALKSDFDKETIEKAILSSKQNDLTNVMGLRKLSLEVLVIVFKASVASVIWPILHSEPKLSAPRTFSANGSITPEMRRTYFFVDPSQQNTSLLLPNILKGGWILLHGPRASGKTTRVFKLFDQLQPQYMMLYVTCQMTANLNTAEAFFKTVMFQIRSALQLPAKPENESFEDEFLKLCYDWIPKYGKKVVLAIDEFDRLYEMASKQECTKVLSVFRSLRDSAAIGHGLQSVIAIGTFSILFATGSSGSPFNVSEAIAAPFFSLQDTTTLFQQFAEERGRAAPKEVVWDIQQRTSGHPGLVCLCGRALDQKVGEISYSNWLKYATFSLPRELVFYQNTQRMVEDLQKPQYGNERHLLSLLVALGMEPLDAGNAIPSAKVLVALGYAKFVEAQKIALMSPLIGHLALQSVLSVDKRQPPSKAFPLLTDEIDIPLMICGAVSAFSRQTLELSKTYSFKTHPGIKGHPEYHQQQIVMPCEAVYHAELYSVIQGWKPANVFLFTNVNVPMENEKDKRCDLSLCYGNLKSYVIELMVHDTQDEIKNHMKKTVVYKKQLEADQAYMVNFTTILPDDHYPYLPGEEGVQAIYVWHNVPFTMWRIYWVKDGKWVSQDVALE